MEQLHQSSASKFLNLFHYQGTGKSMTMNHNANGTTHTSSGFFPEDGIDIRQLIGQLYHHRWIILSSAIFTFLIAFLYTFTIVPQYQTTALIQINSQNANSHVLSGLGFNSTAASGLETQLALLRTRYILEPVITKNNLNIISSPHYFPYIGAWMARHYQGNNVAGAFLGFNKYAWGGEKVEIKQFVISPAFVGQAFQLVAGKGGSYQLYSTQGKLVLNGKVGLLAMANDGTGLQLELSILKARSGTEFTISNQSPVSMAIGLARSLSITPIVGSDSAQNTGVEQLQLTGSDPDQVVRILNAIVNYAIVRNAQQKTEEIRKTLDFLNQRVPQVKTNMQKAEDAVNQYHIKNNTLSMDMTSNILITQFITLKTELEKLKAQKAELLQIYTPNHPIVIVAENKEALLKKKLAEIIGQIRKFPLANQQEMNLLRDSKIKNGMYLSLLNNQQQLEIAKAGLTTDISALGYATPADRMPTYKSFRLFVGFLMGAFLSSLIILIKNILTKTIENSDQLEDELQIPVQCIVPYSQKQRKIEKAYEKGLKIIGKDSSMPLVLAKQVPDDISIESLRSLRVSLHIMSPSSTHRIIALMGSTSGIGKSFVSLNLSQVIADSGKRTLLIDADIRKGRLHRALLQAKSDGLSEYLEGEGSEECTVHAIHQNLSFISCGNYNSHPIELFQKQRFQDLLHKVKNEFDQVIIDTPPMLPVTDAVLIAQYCDTKLFVVSAGKDTMADVKRAIKKAHNHGIEINGIILNHRQSHAPLGSQYYYRYAYGTTS